MKEGVEFIVKAVTVFVRIFCGICNRNSRFAQKRDTPFKSAPVAIKFLSF
jgi:hypothetical protein